MIYAKLAEIQAELFVPKGNYNGFGNYNYRNCEDILQTVKPICKDKGCALFITNDLEMIGERYYVKAEVTLVELETGEQIKSVAHAREVDAQKGMDGSQITGAASSYARKYALAGLFCIDNERDADATNTNGKDAKKASNKDNKASNKNDAPQEPKKASQKQIDYIKQIVQDIDGMLKYYKIDKIEDLTVAQASAIIAAKGGNK